MNYENWKILKSELNNKLEEYATVAKWCNNSNEYHIEDDGTYYKVVENYKPTIEELKQQVRYVRNQYLQDTDKYMLPDFPIDYVLKDKYKYYRQYLRNYTEQENWWEQNPKTFDEWIK